MSLAPTEHVIARLRSHPGRLFAVLDNARDPQILGLIQQAAIAYRCLLEGDDAHGLAAYAPHVVALDDDELLEQLVTRGWGEAWGIYLTSASPFRYVTESLKRMFSVRSLDDEREMLFRFYDPRVARAFLPQANASQRAVMFDEISSYLMEDESADRMVQFTPGDGRIVQTRVAISPA